MACDMCETNFVARTVPVIPSGRNDLNMQFMKIVYCVLHRGALYLRAAIDGLVLPTPNRAFYTTRASTTGCNARSSSKCIVGDIAGSRHLLACAGQRELSLRAHTRRLQVLAGCRVVTLHKKCTPRLRAVPSPLLLPRLKPVSWRVRATSWNVRARRS
jgi:hypothetical protein